MGVQRSNHATSEDPLVLLVHLVASCHAVGRRLERGGVDDAAASVVRRCGIELSLLLEACGVPPLQATTVRSGDRAVDLLASYRRAVRSALPRAVQSVLRDQLARLERSLERAPLAGHPPSAALTADRSLAA